MKTYILTFRWQPNIKRTERVTVKAESKKEAENQLKDVLYNNLIVSVEEEAKEK